MKILTLLLLTGTFCTSAFCQDCPDSFLGTKTLYQVPLQKKTPVPAGYEPVFINHVGRHGARHLTKDVKKTFAFMLLCKADSVSALTPAGLQLKQMVLLLDKIETNNIESISEEGKMELQGIGRRMQAGSPALFSHSLQINTGITNKKRTKQSADAFLMGFSTKYQMDQYLDDTNLRFYDLAPAYLNFEQQGSWMPVFETLRKKEELTQISQTLAAKLFNADFAAKLPVKDQDKLTADLFGFATIVYSLKAEAEQKGIQPNEINFKSLFSCTDLEHLGKVDDAEDFLKKGPGTNINGIQVRIAVPLLVNFIKTTDEFIKHGKYDIQLRFAHAETIAPFAAVLGISTADKDTKNMNQLSSSWKASAIAPLSSNVQWILYKKHGEDNYLVKVLLNEKEVHITGLESKTFPYYPYNELKNLYLQKLKKWGVNINDDMSKYLKEVL